MLPSSRREYIMEKISIEGSVKVERLAQELGVTPMTIRRDLDRLESNYLIRRERGGAVLASRLYTDEEYEVKKEKNKAAKIKIAKKAFDMIQARSVILLDAGTTTYELARLIANDKGFTIVTGDLKIALLLYNTENDVYFIGGKVEKETGAVVSNEFMNLMDRLTIDYAFIGSSSISENGYITTPIIEKAGLKLAMVNSASKSILMVDKSKFGTNALVKIVHVSDFDCIITDGKFSEAVSKKIKQKHVKIYSI